MYIHVYIHIDISVTSIGGLRAADRPEQGERAKDYTPEIAKGKSYWRTPGQQSAIENATENPR